MATVVVMPASPQEKLRLATRSAHARLDSRFSAGIGRLADDRVYPVGMQALAVALIRAADAAFMARRDHEMNPANPHHQHGGLE